MGAALGVSDDAAQKRVARALEKLRRHLMRRGVTTTSGALSMALSTSAVQLAPVGLAATLTSASLTGAGAATGTALALLEFITMAKVKTGIVTALVVAGVATPLVIQHASRLRLREENAALRQQVDQITQLAAQNQRLSNLVARTRSAPTPRLPAPRMQVAAAPTEDLRSTNLIAQILQEHKPRQLIGAQVESYLKENRRSAGSLLAAYRTTGDQVFLEEAMEKFPDDAQVCFDAVFKKDASPAERRQWLEAFKQAAPDNALANYLSALDYFKAGQTEQAVEELNAASGQQRFQDYSWDFYQNSEEAWRAAGSSVAESKTIATVSLLLPHLAELRRLHENMLALANSYRQAGDKASAQLALQMDANLGQRLRGLAGNPMITQLVGMSIESIALRAMDPNTPYGSAGQTVQSQLEELTRQRAALNEFAQQFERLRQTVSAQDWISYTDRWRTFGEEAASRWLLSKYGQK